MLLDLLMRTSYTFKCLWIYVFLGLDNRYFILHWCVTSCSCNKTFDTILTNQHHYITNFLSSRLRIGHRIMCGLRSSCCTRVYQCCMRKWRSYKESTCRCKVHWSSGCVWCWFNVTCTFHDDIFGQLRVSFVFEDFRFGNIIWSLARIVSSTCYIKHDWARKSTITQRTGISWESGGCRRHCY